MKTLVCIISLGLLIQSASSQLVDSNAFIKTNLVELAINKNGNYITDTVPDGYILLNNPAEQYGFIADYNMNGWYMGFPAYSGDFCAPGSPVEEWGISWNGNHHINGSVATDSLPGSIKSYSSNDDSITVVWMADDTSIVTIQQTTTAYTDKLFFLTKLKLVNNSPDTLNDIYYVRSLDPDNEQYWTGDFTTKNGVDVDTNYSYAEGLDYDLFLGLVAGDPLARGSYGNFTLTDGFLYDPYLGTGGYYISGSMTDDISLQMSFYRPEIAPGDSTEFIFAHVFSRWAIEEAYLATLNVDYEVDCSPDTTISASLFTYTTTQINWTDEPGHVYDIIYTNTETGEVDTVHSLISPVSLNDLESCTTYDVYMITQCNDELTYSNVISFTTDCEVLIQEISDNSLAFEIFPNPADDVINIKFSTFINSDFKVVISDMLGKEMISKTEHGITNNLINIPVNQLPAGIYQISVYSGKTFKTIKFIKS